LSEMSTALSLPFPITSVVVHPLVLLSVTDHFTRTSSGDTNKRVVGILLGEYRAGKVDITNSYAVPFEEDPKDPSIWFLDHNYHEEMFAMFKKVNAREKVVGWYSTGKKIKPCDLDINEKIRKYTPHPIYVLVDTNPQDDSEIPTQAFMAVENLPEERSRSALTFVHLPCEIGAFEAEEVGVEHLLRNIRDTLSEGTLGDRIAAKLASLKSLKSRLEEMAQYLDDVLAGRLPVNHQIIYNLQNMFNLSPDLRVKELLHALTVRTNDNMLVIYLSSLIRTIIALHDAINNKLNNRMLERAAADGHKEKEEHKPKDKEDKEKENDKEKAGDKEKGKSS